MGSESQIARRVRDAAVNVLPPGLTVVVDHRPHSAIPAFDITVLTSAGEHHVSAVWAGRGWPADVERAVGLAPAVDVVFAAMISEGARDWLAARQLGWVDEHGGASICMPTGLVISSEARRDPAPRVVSDRWTRSMLAAAEAVLAGVPPTVEAVESRTGLSRGAVANGLARLESMGLLERPNSLRGPASARQVVDVESFIDRYASGAAGLRSRQAVLRLHRLWSDPLEDFATDVAPTLDRLGEPWAVTGAAASTLLAPYLGNVAVIELYVSRDLFANMDLLATTLGGRIVDTGHRIEVRALPTPVSADGPIVNQIRVALPARVYADLSAAGGRSAEAAHHLREVTDVGPHS